MEARDTQPQVQHDDHIIFPGYADGFEKERRPTRDLRHLSRDLAAFVRELAANDIVVLPGDVCCGSCGGGPVDEAVERLGARGGVWFNEQSSWETPYLAHQPAAEANEDDEQTGDAREGFALFVCDIAEAAGFEVEWDGSVNTCIKFNGRAR